MRRLFVVNNNLKSFTLTVRIGGERLSLMSLRESDSRPLEGQTIELEHPYLLRHHEQA